MINLIPEYKIFKNGKFVEYVNDISSIWRSDFVVFLLGCSFTFENELVKNAIKFLSEQFIINGTIEKKDIISSVNKFMIDEKNNSLEKANLNLKPLSCHSH